MSIEYKAELKSQYAQLTCHGAYEKQALLDLLEEALDYAVSTGVTAVLVDISEVEGSPSTADRFEMGEAFAEIQLGKTAIVAMAIVGRS